MGMRTRHVEEVLRRCVSIVVFTSGSSGGGGVSLHSLGVIDVGGHTDARQPQGGLISPCSYPVVVGRGSG